MPFGRSLGIYIALLSNITPHDKRGHLDFSFPGSVASVRSTNADLFATYSTPSPAKDGVRRYLFSVQDGMHNLIVQRDFTRSVEGRWSPFGPQIYLNDFIGSSLIDCFVWEPSSTRLTSLTEVILNDPNSGPVQGMGAKPPENPTNSRFELTCEGWQSPGKILVHIEGETWAGGEFHYRLIYDLKANKYAWQ